MKRYNTNTAVEICFIQYKNQSLTPEAGFQSQISPRGICDEQSRTERGPSPAVNIIPPNLHKHSCTTDAIMYNLSN